MAKKEEQCEGCLISVGGLEGDLTDFRLHRLCGWCIENWEHKEDLAGRILSFEEVTSGKLAKKEKT